MTEPEASVIVPARNAAGTLPRLFEGLAAQDLARDRFEVVVVSNGSTDATADTARDHGAKVLEEPAGNRARARNAGAAVAHGPVYAFIDADCLPERGWLSALTTCLGSAPLAAGDVRVAAREAPNRVERFDRLWRFQQERNVRSGWAASANLGVRREAFEAAGGFDPAYRRVGEDVDLCLRAREAGLALAWCPRAVVWHDAERRLRDVLARAFGQGYASVQHERRLRGLAGRRHWRHPAPLVRGHWALTGLGVEPETLDADARRGMLAIARADYAARIAGSVWAELRRAR